MDNNEKKRIGRPRSNARKLAVNVRVSGEELKALDFIRKALAQNTNSETMRFLLLQEYNRRR